MLRGEWSGNPNYIKGAIGSSLDSDEDNRGINWASSSGEMDPRLKSVFPRKAQWRRKRKLLKDREMTLDFHLLSPPPLPHRSSKETKIVTEKFPFPISHVFLPECLAESLKGTLWTFGFGSYALISPSSEIRRSDSPPSTAVPRTSKLHLPLASSHRFLNGFI